ncbi:MAG: protease inhibitor I42 family protein [Nitrospinae bacterium]|nr:protease inhibitor I42 family protein [Nitrospinota bacterium]
MGEEESDLKSVVAQKGMSFTINLWEDRTRGEQWVPSYDSSVFALTGDDFLRTTSNNAVDSGNRQFEFEALQSGTHRLEFQKRMAWKFTSEDRRVFLVDVKEAEGEGSVR